jgi:hypothetical protein
MLHLNEVQVAQIEKLIGLLDEGFFETLAHNPIHQQTDGNVEIVISLGNTLDRAKATQRLKPRLLSISQ